jgi:hypothetical protein
LTTGASIEVSYDLSSELLITVAEERTPADAQNEQHRRRPEFFRECWLSAYFLIS